MNGPRIIDVVYAYILTNEEGMESVPSILVPEWDNLAVPVMVPLMGADRARVNFLRRYMLSAPELEGRRLQLVKFTVRQLVEEFDRDREVEGLR
jgi:hypothetical protein